MTVPPLEAVAFVDDDVISGRTAPDATVTLLTHKKDRITESDFNRSRIFVENVDRKMAKQWFDDTSEGIMFEVWDVDFYDQYIPYFQLEFGEDDRSSLQGTADALEGTGSAALSAASEHMDLAQFRRFYAVEAVIGQFDSYPYSNPGDDAHVYFNPEVGLLQWLPHGVDETFYYPDHNVTSVNVFPQSRLDLCGTPGIGCPIRSLCSCWE